MEKVSQTKLKTSVHVALILFPHLSEPLCTAISMHCGRLHCLLMAPLFVSFPSKSLAASVLHLNAIVNKFYMGTKVFKDAHTVPRQIEVSCPLASPESLKQVSMHCSPFIQKRLREKIRTGCIKEEAGIEVGVQMACKGRTLKCFILCNL